MTIYNMYIFDRNGTCLFYQEWQRNKSSGMPQEEEFKLMYGLIFSIKSFISRMSPVDFKDGFTNFSTNLYKLHFFEPPSGLKFVLNTSLGVDSLRESLQYIYNSSELFKGKLDTYIRGLPAF